MKRQGKIHMKQWLRNKDLSEQCTSPHRPPLVCDALEPQAPVNPLSLVTQGTLPSAGAHGSNT